MVKVKICKRYLFNTIWRWCYITF